MTFIAPNPRWKEKVDITYEEHMRNMYSGVIALAKELERTIGKEKTREILGRLYLQEFTEWAESLVEESPINSMEDFAALNRRIFGSSRSHIMEITEVTPTSYRERDTSCIFAKVCRDLDAADLGYVMFCATDYPLAQVFNPRMRLERTKTLMQRDDCCDFHYVWEEDEK